MAVALAGDARLQFQGVFRAAFGTGVADAPAVQHGLEQHFLLPLAGGAADQLEDADLVLRDLPQGRVGGADDAEHLGQGTERQARAAVFTGNADAAQAAAGELLDFGPG